MNSTTNSTDPKVVFFKYAIITVVAGVVIYGVYLIFKG